MRKKITIIGHFGGAEDFLDGQTIKTKILYNELSKVEDWKIKKVDTYYKAKKAVKLIWDSFVAMLTTKDIILLVAENGMRFFFPILYFCAKVLKKKVYHCVIGASLDRRVKRYKNFKKYLNSFLVNWVETEGLAERLEKLGVNNVELLYNFKKLDILSEDELNYSCSEPYKICTFSRVMKEKGIEDAIKAVTAINELAGKNVFELDIYGQIDSEQVEWFDKLQQSFPEYIRYKGIVPYNRSVDVLKYYFALVFPTRYYTEGVPGTIIDAYASGLPVIASKWENFDNIIDERTGISYNFEDTDDLISVLREIADKPEIILGKKKKCIVRAADFAPENVVQRVINKIKVEEREK